MDTATVEREDDPMPINVRLPADLRLRLRNIATIRGTSDSATLRWLIGHAVDWWESLDRNERMGL